MDKNRRTRYPSDRIVIMARAPAPSRRSSRSGCCTPGTGAARSSWGCAEFLGLRRGILERLHLASASPQPEYTISRKNKASARVSCFIFRHTGLFLVPPFLFAFAYTVHIAYRYCRSSKPPFILSSNLFAQTLGIIVQLSLALPPLGCVDRFALVCHSRFAYFWRLLSLA